MDTSLRQSVFIVPVLLDLADRSGAFAAAELAVSTDLVSSSVAQRDDLAAGRCDVAITAIDNLFAWNAAGADIALLAQIEVSTQLMLAVRPGLTDLDVDRPIRLGVDAPNNGFAVVLRAYMTHRGVTAEQYTLVEIGGVRERLDALVDGVVDATLLSPPLDKVAVSRGASIVGPTLDEVAPGYPGLGVVASRRVLADKRPQVVRYLGALTAALTTAHTTSDAGLVELLADNRYNEPAVAALRADLPATLAPPPSGLRVLADLRTQLDMQIPGAPSPEELVDADVATAVAEIRS